jgi:AcrR family transcriptional regulator
MLEVVAERGFHDAPMSLIAKRSGASAGVIYHHFSSKEEIIQALYQRLSELKRRQILAGYTPGTDARDAFVQVALNAYRFYRQHQRELRFLEQFELAGFPCPPPPTLEEEAQVSDFERRFTPRSRGGVLNELPDDVYRELTMGVILRLAKLPKELSESTLQELAQKVWEVVKAPEQN